MLADYKEAFWLGLKRSGDEHEWMNPKLPVTFTNWMADQPSGEADVSFS